ncbi:hypothetical protein PF003_g32824 [Phytophthora fragariae]|nr:hypothetical protein PF003_g32824 [Phytophthora fragariae]
MLTIDGPTAVAPRCKTVAAREPAYDGPGAKAANAGESSVDSRCHPGSFNEGEIDHKGLAITAAVSDSAARSGCQIALFETNTAGSGNVGLAELHLIFGLPTSCRNGTQEPMWRSTRTTIVAPAGVREGCSKPHQPCPQQSPDSKPPRLDNRLEKILHGGHLPR